MEKHSIPKNIEVDIDVSTGCKNKEDSKKQISPKEREELRKVFSGEDFKL